MPPTRTKKIINLVAIIFRICRAFSTDPIIKLIIDLAHAVQSWCVTFPRARARSLATFNINRGVMKCVNIKIKKLFQLLIPRVRPAITERKREKCILGSCAPLINDTQKINTLFEFIPLLFPPPSLPTLIPPHPPPPLPPSLSLSSPFPPLPSCYRLTQCSADK